VDGGKIPKPETDGRSVDLAASYRASVGNWMTSGRNIKTTLQGARSRDALVAGNTAPWEDFRDKLSSSLIDWSSYSSHGTIARAYQHVD
jgi:hypothetical protein